MAIKNITCTDLTIPTGGTLTANSSTVTCSGDFTTTGGLLGASCFQQDDEVNHNTLNTKATVGSASKFDIDNFTIEAWVKVEQSSQGFTIFHNGSGDQSTGIWLAVWANHIRFDINGVTDGNVTMTTDNHASITDNKWHHIAAVRNGTSKKVYIDGKLIYSVTVGDQSVGSEGSNVFIGTARNDGYTFVGKIDDVRFWNDERTETEIRANMFSEVTADSSLVAYYKFNEGTGSTVEDDCHSSHTDADLTINQSGSASTSNWAGAGTFNISGDPTLNMSGTGTMTIPHGFDLHNLTAAASGQTTTVTVPAANNDLDIEGLLTLDGGTFTDGSTGLDLLLKGTSTPVMGSSTFANINRVIYNANDTIIAGTTYDNLISNGTGQTLGGATVVTNSTTTDSASSSVLSTNGYNLTTKTFSAESGTTLNLDKASSLIFSDNSGCGFGTSAGTLNCKGDAAALFDGASDKISVANGASIQNLETYSYSFWVKQPVRARENIIYKGTNVQLEITADGAITAFRRYNTSNDVATTSTTLTADTWYHIVWLASDDGSTLPDIYINGSEASYASNTAGTGTSTDDSGSALTIGYGTGSSVDFEGSIADFRIYKDKILSASEIATLYNSGSNPAINGGNEFADPDNDLGATDWWKLNESNFPTDNAANSAGSTVGTVTGAKSNRITVTSSNAGTPSNYWDFDTGMAVTADYTTFTKLSMLRNNAGGAAIDIDNCTFDGSSSGNEIVYLHGTGSVTSFTNNTITSAQRGLFVYQEAIRNFDNITVNGVLSTFAVKAEGNAAIEFTNSNFDITNSAVVGGSDTIISKDHNDTTDLYEILTAGVSYSTLTNEFSTDADVKLRAGTLTMNEDNKVCDTFNVYSGATIRVTDGNDLYVQGTFDNDGTWVQTAGYDGDIHVGDFTPFDSGDILDNTDFVDTGFHDMSHYLEMDL